MKRQALLPVLLIAGVPLGAMLLLAPARAGEVTDHNFVGAQGCRACHQAEYETWAAGPHARAMQHLEGKQRSDGRCTECHTMVPGAADAALEAVQCEVCHGPGRYYAVEHVMRDKVLREALYFEVPSEKTCERCHGANTPAMRPFDYAKALERIRHWPKPAEPAPSVRK